jgi:hypothetical protein
MPPMHSQVTGYGPQPGKTQALVIVTVEFEAGGSDDVYGSGTE